MIRAIKLVVVISALILLLPQTLLAQQRAQSPLQRKEILGSFARTVRSQQYACSSCTEVTAAGREQGGLAYKVMCRSGRSYRVVLTPRKEMIVQPEDYRSALHDI